ncbi:energy transducer TonB [Segetibacter aerophilus]|nr:energy transducer TonB [Segetibacter aerophilus]
MKTLQALVFLLGSLTTYAQHIEHYYDWQWKPSTISQARFLTTIDYKDSVWYRRDFYVRERSLRMSGSFLDSSCKIGHGKFQYFHPNKSLESLGDFVNGKKEGIWVSFYPNKIIRDSSLFKDGKPIGTSFRWHSNGYISDSSIYNEDGSGVSVGWFDNGAPSRAGRYAPGRAMNGKWQFFHKNGKLSSTEIYTDGRLVNKTYFDEDGNTIADTTNRDHEATFKGGSKGWVQFLQSQVYFPSQYKIVNGDAAVVVVTGVVDEEGNMTDVEVNTPFYPDFDRIAVNAVRKSPKWTPAVDHNRRVKYLIRQAVTFAQE